MRSALHPDRFFVGLFYSCQTEKVPHMALQFGAPQILVQIALSLMTD